MKNHKKRKNLIVKVILASLVGIINGFLGGGGGLVCVPTLEKFFNLETKKSHATAIAIMLPLSIASSIVYIVNNNIIMLDILLITIGVIGGGIIGAFLLKKLNENIIRWIFIVVLFSAGIRMVI